MSKTIDLSIIIPALNEEKRIGASLDELALFIKQNKFVNKLTTEVIVVTSGNKDATRQIVESKASKFRCLRLLNPNVIAGKGRDVKLGMLKAEGNYVIFFDADLAVPLKHLSEFYESCKSGYDLVVGTKNLKSYHSNRTRRYVSILGNVMFRIVSGVNIEDSQCGFKMFTQNASKLCFSKMTILGWGFDMEILTIAHVNKLSIKSVRINDWEDKPFSTFNDSVLKNSLSSLFDLSKIAMNRILHTYSYKIKF